MTALAVVLLFLTDGASAYASVRWLEAWKKDRLRKALVWNAGLELILGINLGAFITLGWLVATPISVVASCTGVALAWRRTRPSNSVVESPAVNRTVEGSIPSSGV